MAEYNFDGGISRIENIRVVCRFRPPSAREIRWSQKHNVSSDVPVIEDSKVITVTCSSLKETPLKPTPRSRKTKLFRACLDDVLGPEATQKQIFKFVGQPVVLSCLEGYNNTIFAYGQSGSGKTYTVELQLLQIYKSELRDLLNPNSATKLVITTDFNDDSVQIQNLRTLQINNVEEAFTVLTEGQSNRVVSGRKLNSGSHMLVMIKIQQRAVDGTIVHSKLNFGDLAGSENITKSLSQYTDFESSRRESIAINSSLSALTTVMMNLSKGQRPSYRENPLTHILKDSLGGNSKTLMFVACSPHIQNRAETIRTLQFASCAKNIRNTATKNKEECKEFLIRRVKDLEGELLKMEAQLLEEKNKKRNLALHLSKMCSVSNRPSGTTAMLSPVTTPGKCLDDVHSLHQIAADVADTTRTVTPKVAVAAQSLMQSVTQSIVCGNADSEGSPKQSGSMFAVASSTPIAKDTENNDKCSTIAVDLNEVAAFKELEDENTQIIYDLRKHLDSVMEEKERMRMQIMNKNQELRTISDERDRLQVAIRNQMKGLMESNIYIPRQRSQLSYQSRCVSEVPTVTDEDEPKVPPLPLDTRSQSFAQSQSIDFESSLKSNQLLVTPLAMNENNVGDQKLNISTSFQNNYENTQSGRRSSALQSKLLDYLSNLQRQVQMSPFVDFTRETSEAQPEPRQLRQQSQMKQQRGGRTSSILSPAEGDEELDDTELETLMRMNNCGRKRTSSISNASRRSMASNRNSITDRRRSKKIPPRPRRRKSGQIRRASAPLISSLLNEFESCIMRSPDPMLASINERSTNNLYRFSRESTEDDDCH